jgi:hypothetical protein
LPNGAPTDSIVTADNDGNLRRLARASVNTGNPWRVAPSYTTIATAADTVNSIWHKGFVGIGTNNPTVELEVNGDAIVWGYLYNASDKRIKNVKGNFTDGLNVINQINPIKFSYNENAPGYMKEDGEHVGVIAQDLEKIAPYMVSKKDYAGDKATNKAPIQDLRSVKPEAYTFLLINAVKEQQAEIEKLQSQNGKQQSQIEKLQLQNDKQQQTIDALLKRMDALEKK